MSKYTYIAELLLHIQREKNKIKKTFLLDDCRISIIELTRSIDSSFVYVNFVLNKEMKEYNNAVKVFNFISTGFFNSLNIFLDKSIYKSGYPLFPSNIKSIEWANNVNLGHIGYVEKFIQLAKQDFFKIDKCDSNYKFINLSLYANREQLVVEDFYWWQNQIKFSEKELERLEYLKPIVDKQINEKVAVWKKYFIKYDCSPELDEHYELVGRFYKRKMVGSDSFPLESKFGLLTFGEIIMIIEAIIGYSIKHKDHCLALLKKTNYKINPWNIYPLDERIDDLANSIASHKNLNYNEVYSFLKVFAIDDKDIEKLSDSPGNAPPPLIRISKEFVLKSIAGALNNPFAYLTRSLKCNYERDYFNAVNDREKVFKIELYELLKAPNLITISRNINLKLDGKLITDIDALIYDTNSKTIFLIQLKWLDDYGSSMKMRNNMSKNFYSSSIKWIDNVKSWLLKNDVTELLKHDLKSIKKDGVLNIELLILGRNFSHFSDQKEDKRAIWCSWYTLIKLVSENQSCIQDLSILANIIKKNNLKHNTKLSKDEIDSVDDEILQVGNSNIIIGF